MKLVFVLKKVTNKGFSPYYQGDIMIRPNLPKCDDCDKSVYSVRLYQKVLDRLEEIEDATGISKQNLVRTAINNFIDSDEVKSI